jgi:ribosome-associated protein
MTPIGTISITDRLSINESDIQIDFVQSSGPGGQNVNKIASQAQLRFNTAALPEDVRTRLAMLAPSRITSDGTLVIHAGATARKSKPGKMR